MSASLPFIYFGACIDGAGIDGKSDRSHSLDPLDSHAASSRNRRTHAREREVLCLIAKGASNREIAEALYTRSL